MSYSLNNRFEKKEKKKTFSTLFSDFPWKWNIQNQWKLFHSKIKKQTRKREEKLIFEGIENQKFYLFSTFENYFLKSKFIWNSLLTEKIICRKIELPILKNSCKLNRLDKKVYNGKLFKFWEFSPKKYTTQNVCLKNQTKKCLP